MRLEGRAPGQLSVKQDASRAILISCFWITLKTSTTANAPCVSEKQEDSVPQPAEKTKKEEAVPFAFPH